MKETEDDSSPTKKKRLHPEIQLILKVRNHLREMIKKTAKQYDNDPDTLSIRCPKNHLLARDNGIPVDLVDDNYRPKCFKCKQPNLPAHQMYYRCIHEDCKTKGHYYELCRICALCEN